MVGVFPIDIGQEIPMDDMGRKASSWSKDRSRERLEDNARKMLQERNVKWNQLGIWLDKELSVSLHPVDKKQEFLT